jgi:murein DD-endopeptidase MepM/ murein hydrolase activator NlpD
MKSIVIDPSALLRTPVKPGQSKAKLLEVAQQFEAILLKEVTKHAVPKGAFGDDQSIASKTWGDMLSHQLASNIAEAGTTGLSKLLAERFSAMSGIGANGNTAKPAKITSHFGERTHPVTGKHQHHDGVDVALPVGTTLFSPFAGRVSRISASENGGLSLTINHPGGRSTTYRHLQASLLKEGQVLSAGQAIAKSGESGRVTGAHLHLEARNNGHLVDPMDLIGQVLKKSPQGVE